MTTILDPKTSIWMSEARWRIASIKRLFTRFTIGASLANLSRRSFSSVPIFRAVSFLSPPESFWLR